MYDLAFRCDASKYHKIGTGHLYRSLAIAEALSIKYNKPKKKIIFICKKNNLFTKTKKLINEKGFKVLHFNKNKEISFLKDLNCKKIVFDRMQFEKKALIKMIKKKYIKIVFLEALNNFIGDCLRINSLIHKKNVKNSGYNFLISPLINEKLNKSLIDKNKVFINLGGINKKLVKFIYKKLKNIKNLKFCVPKDTNINGKNIEYYSGRNFYKKLKESKIVICSGGLIFFDSIFLNKKILVIPKDKHQRDNLINVNRQYKIKIPFIENITDLKFTFQDVYKKRSNLKILNLNDMRLTLKLIYNYLYK